MIMLIKPIRSLEEGVATRYEIEEGGVRNFDIDVSGVDNDEDILHAIITPNSGDCDLYGSFSVEKPSKANCEGQECYHSTNLVGGDSFFIKKTDEKWADTFHVGIDCVTKGYLLFNYWVASPSKKTYITLVDGQTQVIESDGYASRDIYLQYTLPEGATSPMRVLVDATSGDPDVFLRANSTPSPWQYDRKSTAIGSDEIIIYPEDDLYIPGTTYYVLVHGFMSYHKTTRYQAFVTSEEYTELLQGVVLNEYVKAGKYNYYKLYWAYPHADLYMALKMASFWADADIYVTTDDSQKPGPDHYEWKHVDWGNDELEIPDATGSAYFIGINGVMNSKFTFIGYQKNELLHLVDGKPFTFTIQPGENIYFVYRNFASEPMDINFHLEASEHYPYPRLPEFYVSSTELRPNRTTAERRGSRWLSSTTLTMRYQEQPNFYLSIMNPLENNHNYTLTLSASSLISKTTLHDGKQIDINNVGYQQYKYFVFRAYTSKTVTFSINPYQGEVDLYVSTELDYPTKESCNDTSCWTSENYHADSVIVDADDSKRVSTLFKVGVRGLAQANGFAIVAHMDRNYTILGPGNAVSGSVRQDHRSYYRYSHFKKGPFSIDLSVKQPNTDVNLYLSLCSVLSHPDEVTCADAAKCKKSEKFGDDTINVEDGDMYDYCIGVVGTKAVPSYHAIEYTIRASAGFETLSPNTAPAYRTSSAESNDYFHIRSLNLGGTYVLISVTLLEGDTKLFLNNNTNTDQDNWDIVDDGWPSNALLFKQSQLYDVPEYQFRVLSEADSSYIASITENIPYSASPLQLNVPRVGIAPPDDYLYFKILLCAEDECHFNDPLTNDYRVSIKVLSGNVGFYMNQDFANFPTADNAVIASEGHLDRSFSVNGTNFNQGYFYIGFTGLSGTTPRFIITLTELSASVVLADDVSYIQSATDIPGTMYIKKNVLKNDFTTFMYASCHNAKAPVFYFADDKAPPPSPSEFQKQSSPAGEGYVQLLELNKLDSDFFRVYAQNSPAGPFEINSFNRHNGPVLPLDASYKTKRSGDNLILSFYPSTSNDRFPPREVIYSVYLYEQPDVVDGKSINPDAVNFYTMCAAKHLGVLNGEFSDNSVGGSSSTDRLEYTIDGWSPTKNYQLMVIVRDPYSLSNRYQSGWLLRDGEYRTAFVPQCFGRLGDNPDVCSGNGLCSAYNTCKCDTGYFGATCSEGLGGAGIWKVILIVFFVLLGLFLLAGFVSLIIILIVLYKKGKLRLRRIRYASLEDEEDENPFAVSGNTGYDEI